MVYERGAVVKGPDLFADYDYRPYICLSNDTHPFSSEEALYVAVTTTHRAAAVPLAEDDFAVGGLPRESYVNPWTIVSIRHADMQERRAASPMQRPRGSHRRPPATWASTDDSSIATRTFRAPPAGQ